MPPLTGDLLWDVVRHIPRAKAQGLDAWSPGDLKALPREAFDDLADVLAQVEAEGKWPEGLRNGGYVSLRCSPRRMTTVRWPRGPSACSPLFPALGCRTRSHP